MNRVLVAALVVAGVVGATGGVLVAVDRADDPTSNPRSTASDPSSDPSGDPSGDPTDDPSSDPTGTAGADDAFWANQRVLHDRGQDVPVALPFAPVALERATGGWVVSTVPRLEEPFYETSVVSPDGTVRFLAGTTGEGDVSPDGTRYVAKRNGETGYGVWDIASGELVETVTGASPDQEALGVAQFVDDDTVASSWRPAGPGPDVVLVGDLGSDEPTLVSDDIVGGWAISPDGRWIAGVSATGKDAETGFALCALLAPTDRSDVGVTDCGSTFVGVPSFAPDSRAVVAQPVGDPTTVSERLLSTEVGVGPSGVPVPDFTQDAAFLDADRLLVLGPANRAGDGIEVSVCGVVETCEVVDQYGDPAATAVLGTTT